MSRAVPATAKGACVPVEIGEIEALFRYPVKSMRGEQLDAVAMGWHGLDGDRRFAFRRVDARGGFPWLTAGKLPDLISFTPLRLQEDGAGDAAPTHVRTPAGDVMPLHGEALAMEVGRRFGAPVQMMHLKHGIFDDASISLIATATVLEIGRLANREADARRFRPNILVRTTRAIPFEEDQWVGGVLRFGDADDGPAVTVTMRDVRCAMVNIDPDGGSSSPEMLKACVRGNENNVGVYATVTRVGALAVGQKVFLQ